MALKNFDIKDLFERIDDVVDEIKSDDKLKEKFLDDPVKTLEDLLNVNLPDEKVEKFVKMIKNKIDDSGVDDKLDKLGNKIGNFFDKIEDKFD